MNLDLIIQNATVYSTFSAYVVAGKVVMDAFHYRNKTDMAVPLTTRKVIISEYIEHLGMSMKYVLDQLEEADSYILFRHQGEMFKVTKALRILERLEGEDLETATLQAFLYDIMNFDPEAEVPAPNLNFIALYQEPPPEEEIQFALVSSGVVVAWMTYTPLDARIPTIIRETILKDYLVQTELAIVQILQETKGVDVYMLIKLKDKIIKVTQSHLAQEILTHQHLEKALELIADHERNIAALSVVKH